VTLRVLGLETSGPECRVAVLTLRGRPGSALEALDAGRAVERSGRSEFARHSEIIYGLLDGVLDRARSGLRDLDGIAVSIGPGSFTGLRVGLTVAKVLARFGRTPLAGVSTLEAMALDGRRRSAGPDFLPVIDARRGEVYAAAFRATGSGVRKVGGPWVVTPARLAALAPVRACSLTGPPRAATIAALGIIRLLANRHADPARLVPAYLRRPQAVEQRLGG